MPFAYKGDIIFLSTPWGRSSCYWAPLGALDYWLQFLLGGEVVYWGILLVKRITTLALSRTRSAEAEFGTLQEQTGRLGFVAFWVWVENSNRRRKWPTASLVFLPLEVAGNGARTYGEGRRAEPGAEWEQEMGRGRDAAEEHEQSYGWTGVRTGTRSGWAERWVQLQGSVLAL